MFNLLSLFSGSNLASFSQGIKVEPTFGPLFIIYREPKASVFRLELNNLRPFAVSPISTGLILSRAELNSIPLFRYENCPLPLESQHSASFWKLKPSSSSLRSMRVVGDGGVERRQYPDRLLPGS